jgi:hypothetical protein
MQISEPIVRNRDCQGSEAPQPRRPIDVMAIPAPRFGSDLLPVLSFSVREDLPEVIETAAPPRN